MTQGENDTQELEDLPANYSTQIRVSAMRRSGSHAILNWLADQFPGNKVDFYNDTAPGKNPVETHTGTGLPVLNSRPESEHEIVIFSYEDKKLSDINTQAFRNNQRSWLGPSRARYDLIILRDPLNQLASRWYLEQKADWIRPRMSHPNESTKIVALWKSYAYEYLGHTHLLTKRKVPLNYNRWVFDTSYRRALSNIFPGTRFSDQQRNIIPGYGWGSSFDKKKDFNNKANEMKLFERYKSLMKEPHFKELLNDEELVHLADLIFGISYTD